MIKLIYPKAGSLWVVNDGRDGTHFALPFYNTTEDAVTVELKQPGYLEENPDWLDTLIDDPRPYHMLYDSKVITENDVSNGQTVGTLICANQGYSEFYTGYDGQFSDSYSPPPPRDYVYTANEQLYRNLWLSGIDDDSRTWIIWAVTPLVDGKYAGLLSCHYNRLSADGKVMQDVTLDINALAMGISFYDIDELERVLTDYCQNPWGNFYNFYRGADGAYRDWRGWNSLWRIKYSKPRQTLDQAISTCNSLIPGIPQGPPVSYYPNWGAHVSNAINDIDAININGIAYLKDALEAKTMLKSMALTLQSLPSRKVKAVASAYLGLHYGLKLTILDTIEIVKQIKALQSEGKTVKRVTSREKAIIDGWSITTCYSLWYDPYNDMIGSLSGYLRYFDLDLSIDKVWDLVPFSFVIDWFLHIGDALETVARFGEIQRFKILLQCQSEKYQRQINVDASGISGTVDLTYYRRKFSDKLIPPDVQLINPSLPGKCHIWEAAALIFSKD